jgi:hypothetical protein
LRDGNTRKTPPTTRKSRSRSNSGSGWSSDDNKRSRKSRRTWSRETSPSKDKFAIEPTKLLKSAKEIQRHVQQKLREQQEEEDKKMKEMERQLEEEANEIERRMEREANGHESPSTENRNDENQKEKSPEPDHLYTPPETKSHTPELVATA